MLHSFKHKGLQELYEAGKTGRIDRGMHKRIIRRLDAWASASRPENMNIPGSDFHRLQGSAPIRDTVHINGSWCVTFEWDDGAENVDYVQYH
ncbi:MAG: plasmid maintenance system killer [Candidatus Scalindua sp.]|jgi:proteic killer suppression protein|nr:plasmid maintenance system killer [Candidatus Scalindua sp.]MBT5307654.1 plasmid maintenance system killer [Candidatus Scalindua sp.]MBT6230357.1 plasmid maintenance system killer [Candidatus Scalindua sp.]MBT6563658.1 plasmid maintenance system killer [Candidatus Scalindua sp.]MBT7210084.1 plasmid maintenance system killer [Candidatus Scalindua sp.]